MLNKELMAKAGIDEPEYAEAILKGVATGILAAQAAGLIPEFKEVMSSMTLESKLEFVFNAILAKIEECGRGLHNNS